MSAAAKRKPIPRTAWYISALLWSLAALCLSMFASALLVQRGLLEPGLMEYLALGCVLLASAVGGGRAAKRKGRGGLTAGLVAGAMLLALLMLLALIVPGGQVLTPMSLRIAIACAVGGAFGGTLSSTAVMPRRNRRRHR